MGDTIIIILGDVKSWNTEEYKTVGSEYNDDQVQLYAWKMFEWLGE